jgi:magnesium transporter
LETIGADRHRLAGALNLYMSSIANRNRNAEATKALTLLGTAALPGLVITGIFGMNIDRHDDFAGRYCVSPVIPQTERTTDDFDRPDVSADARKE